MTRWPLTVVSLTLYLAMVALPGWAVQPVVPDKDAAPAEGPKPTRQKKITLARETTRILEPVTAEGYPDYVEYLNRQISAGVTPKNNAVVLLWQVVSPKVVSPEIRDEYFRRLGMPIPPEVGDYLEKPEQFAIRNGDLKEGEEEPFWNEFDNAYRRPWIEKDHPALAKWLKASERSLNLAVEASRRERYYSPLVSESAAYRLISVQLPMAQESRQICRALACRAMLRLGNGQLDEAWQDVLTIKRLSGLVSAGPFLVDGLVSIALNDLACEAQAVVMHFGRPTRDQALRFGKDIAAIQRSIDIAQRVDVSERFCMLDAMCSICQHGPMSLIDAIGDNGADQRYSGPIFKALANYATDWDAALKASNRFYDDYVAAVKIEDVRVRRRAMSAIDKRLERISEQLGRQAFVIPLLPLGGKEGRVAAGRYMAALGAALLMPGMSAALSAEQRSSSIDRRAEIVAALAAYRGDHHTYPVKLADLVPDYLDKLPKDAFTDAEFRYRLTEDGFELYSIGDNGVDDGGRGWNDDPAPGTPTGDDWLLTVPPKAKSKK